MPNKNTRIPYILAILLALFSSGFSQTLTWKPYRGGVSDRDLLNLGDPVLRLNRISANQVQLKAVADTLNILAIRVEFQEDTNALTTGNGKFDLSTAAEIPIDAPPHELTYFESQLLALKNYFQTVSHSKLILQFEVYPKDPARTYVVSKEMSQYSAPSGADEELDRGISTLFQEAFQLADATDDIDFSQYNSFILFHSGVGRDFAFDFNDTPLDIPSAFLDFNTLKRSLADDEPSFKGVSVADGNVFIRDGLVLPETQSQKGFTIGLLGTTALMFGSQIGLPVLFNSETGLPGIGVFGLMDQGSGNFGGLLPAEPCAWSKVFLGWEIPIVVRAGDNLPVAASQAAGQDRIYKIPIDSKEYFLVENRYRDFNEDGVAIGRTANGTRVEFKWVVSNGQLSQEILFDGPSSVITEVNEYDFGLPTIPTFPTSGSGILIWHIDERIIAANLASNRVNGNPELRGVDLEEADGAQDIGQIYGFLSAGAGSENGVIEDMFWGSNEINLLVNSSTKVEFTPFTTPGSISNSGANPEIYITDFSEPGSEMTFSVRNEITAAGFPQFSGSPGGNANSPIIVDLNNDGNKEIILTSSTNTDVWVWSADGSKFIDNSESTQLENLGGTTQTLPLALFAAPRGTAAFSPAVASADLQSAVIVVTDQVVAAYLPEDISPQDGRADSLYVFESPEMLTTPPLIVASATAGIGFQVIVGTEQGSLLVVDSNGAGRVLSTPAADEISGLALLPTLGRIVFVSKNGEIGLTDFAGTAIWRNEINESISFAPVIGDLDQDGNLEIVSITDNGDLYQFALDGTSRTGFPRSTGLRISSEISVGDIDGDGYFEITLVAENKLYAFNHVGTLENNFPVELSSTDGIESNRSSPVLVDLEGDGTQEIIVGSPENQLLAFHFTGESVSIFPLSTGKGNRSTPFLADIEDDGDLDLAVASNDGFLYVWDLPYAFVQNQIAWNGLFHDVAHSNANLMRLQTVPTGAELMPGKSVYNYPNPTEGNSTTIRYTLNFPANVNIKIYDLAGELVDELPGTGFGQAENEVVWGLDNIESGVYLASVQAEGNGTRKNAIIKIAVVK